MIRRPREIAQWSLAVALLIGVTASSVLAQDGGRITGAIVDEDGNPVEGVLVVAENPNLNPPRFEHFATTGENIYSFD